MSRFAWDSEVAQDVVGHSVRNLGVSQASMHQLVTLCVASSQERGRSLLRERR